MNITAEIKGIIYKLCLEEKLNCVDLLEFDINTCSSSCLVSDCENRFAISKWVSPKRTRSYPFERVYDTLHISKKITVIPIVKDEGFAGDRDFIQWDTVSLMSLLDVFVIFAYYHKAEKKGNKITNQQFDNQYIIEKIKEIENYHSSTLHWNLNELKTNFQTIVDKTISSYTKIEQQTGVKLHNIDGIEKFKEKIGKDVANFMEFSREKAEKAQEREMLTIQPKESLASLSKAKITFTNYLGGKYFLTVDEVRIEKSKLFLIEGKYSKNAILPSKGDIKDGLLKMILYSNLSEGFVEDKNVEFEAVLSLTSCLLQGEINNKSNSQEVHKFLEINKISDSQRVLIDTIFKEANQNNFTIKIGYSK